MFRSEIYDQNVFRIARLIGEIPLGTRTGLKNRCRTAAQ